MCFMSAAVFTVEPEQFNFVLLVQILAPTLG